MGSDITAEQRRRMIAEAAYYRAQQRGFEGGDATEDWLAAEAEIERALAAEASRLSSTQQELDQLMARAREAQIELLAEALKVKLQEQARTAGTAQPANGESFQIAWEALSAALRSIAPERD